MKIIDIAICVDNFDPKGLGRIRCVRYATWVGQQEKALDYTAWSDDDLFTAINKSLFDLFSASFDISNNISLLNILE